MKRLLVVVAFSLIIQMLFCQLSNTSFKYTYISFEKGVYSYIYDSEKTIPFTESVICLNDTLTNGLDYKIDYVQSRITFLTNKAVSPIRIEYAVYPASWINSLKVYSIQIYSDSMKVNKPKSDIFSFWNNSSKLNISGSKSFSVSVSNQENVSINQSMFLKINGEISDNVKIEAQLNDSESPITPEGSSRELSSLDQVYFKVYGSQYELAFGDLEMEYKNTNFINYLNKFEGVKASYFSENQVQVALALTKSKNASMDFMGIEGKQGPYYLKSNTMNSNVKVISGTEQVYLDSELMNRGDDYSIDYDEGTITFSIKHFISANNKILVNFQYSDENYRKNLYLFRNTYNLTDQLQLSFHTIMQSDDKNNPIDMSFTDAEIDSLKRAGDSYIFVDGANEVGPGLGKYRKVTEGSNSYYVYTNIDSLAIYQVSFTYVGQGYGDYRLSSTLIYEYVGHLLGDYLPIKKINPPEYKGNWDFKTTYTGDLYALDYEILLSKNDLNTFSSKDCGDDNSYIQNLSFSLYPEWEDINPRLLINLRDRNKDLFSFAEINELQDNQFSAFSAPDSLAGQEFMTNISYNYFKYFAHTAYYHRIINTDYDKQDRYYSNLYSEQLSYLPALRYLFAKGLRSMDNGQKLNLLNNEFSASYKYKLLELKSFYKNQMNESLTQDTLKTGNKLLKRGFESLLNNYKNTSLGFSYDRDDNYNKATHWEKLSFTDTYAYNLLYQNKNSIANLKYSHRKVNYTIGSSNNQNFDLLELRANTQLYKSFIQSYLNYSINNIEYYPKIRELQYVGEAEGNYDSTGVWLENGGYDWYYVLSGNPEQTLEVKNDFNLILNPGQITDNQYLKKTQFETWLLVNENTKSKENMQIYLLNPHYLMDDSLSIYSRQVIRQSVWYNLIPQKTILKYSYLLDKTLDNRYQNQSSNKIISHEWNLRLNKMYRSDWEYTFSTSKERDSKYSTQKKAIKHKINSRYSIGNNYIFNTELAYEEEKNNNYSQNVDWTLDKLIMAEDIMIFMGNRYRLNTRFDVTYNKSDYSYTFYIPESKRKGYIYKWNSSMYYKINQFTQFNIEYSGYDYPQSEIMHQLSMEIKAEF